LDEIAADDRLLDHPHRDDAGRPDADLDAQAEMTRAAASVGPSRVVSGTVVLGIGFRVVLGIH
jgi:hypothetical protein